MREPFQGTKVLDGMLERWTVHDDWDNEQTAAKEQWQGWYAVSNDDGIVAYFGDRDDAYRWRLSMINRDLNP